MGSPTVHLPNGASVEPDALLSRLGADAVTHVVGKGKGSRLHGAPELVVEVAISTLDEDVDDAIEKRADYREAGVREYLVVAPTLDQVHWWRLEDGGWTPLEVDPHGVAESQEFPALRLDMQALLGLDAGRVLTALLAEPS
ncbi:MAG: Uma2 family endonuclease [Myxococcales bacterium]|nr:Uma2 family endonuclease [Myxococcales bacterium]